MADISIAERDLVEKIIEWHHDFVENGNDDLSMSRANEIAEAFEERFENGQTEIPYYSAVMARNFYDIAGNDAAQSRMEETLDNYNPTHLKTANIITDDMWARGDAPEAAANVAVWPDEHPGGWSFIQGRLHEMGFENASLDPDSLTRQFAAAHDNIIQAETPSIAPDVSPQPTYNLDAPVV